MSKEMMAEDKCQYCGSKQIYREVKIIYNNRQAI